MNKLFFVWMFFWNTIAAYNAATWPVQLLLVAVAAVLTLLLYLRPRVPCVWR